MKNSPDTLINPLLAFHFEVPLNYWPGKWSARGIDLPAEYRMPSLNHVLHRGPSFADLRMGWNERGLAVWLTVTGKKSPPWCRLTRPEESDGLQLYFGLRETRSLRRANRYCHQFTILPTVEPAGGAGPRMLAVPIQRAVDNPPEVRPNHLQIQGRVTPTGYQFSGWISAEALHDFAPQEQPTIGFTYVVVDRELGWQSFNLSPDYPLADPSLWGRLRLVAPAGRAKST
ncbi:MAG: hypothetical protein U0795_16950 [Pirellulales bacterium]